MIQNRPCVNGIVAAVLSASIVPTHGALAKEKSLRLLKINSKPAAPKVEALAVIGAVQAPTPNAALVQ
ncbi:hypothetical protein AMST5_03667 [freshwater sediment metagenome]|jgi:hypothetical protein|uniref:Uncharacterized protein n=1 Tax=freshwater sediment metagenome TaxID=556182 RepID=A0AA48RAM6_9ZZZZ